MLGRNARERSLSEGEGDDDRKCYQPSISSRPCTSRQLVDQLSDHLGIYHAKQIAGDTKHQRVDVLKFFRALTLKQRVEALTCTDETWIALLYEMIYSRREKSEPDRFQVLFDELQSSTPTTSAAGSKSTPQSRGKKGRKGKGKKKTKRKDGAGGRKPNGVEGMPSSVLSSLREKAKQALCLRKSTMDYRRLREEGAEKVLEENSYLYAANAVRHFNAFAVSEALLNDVDRFCKICDRVSLGRFLESDDLDRWKLHETEWLQGMGYYTVAAFIVSKIELLLVKAFTQQRSSSSSILSPGHARAPPVNKRETLSQEHQRLCRSLCLRCLLQQVATKLCGSGGGDGSDYERCRRKLVLLMKSVTHPVISSSRFYISQKACPDLDEQALVAQERALGIIAEMNERKLLEEIQGEIREERELVEKRIEKKRKKKKKKNTPKEQLKPPATEEEAEVPPLESANPHPEAEEATARGNGEDLQVQVQSQNGAMDVPVESGEQEEEGEADTSWLEEAFIPEPSDSFSWANIFGTQPGASFYWSSGVEDHQQMIDFERDGSESWTSSTRQEFVLGSLLSNLEQTGTAVLASPQGSETLGDLELKVRTHPSPGADSTSEKDEGGAGFKSGIAPGLPRSESLTSSPRFSHQKKRASQRRPSLEHVSSSASASALVPGGAGAHKQKKMGRWLLQRRSSEVLLLSRSEPKANSPTSFFMSSSAPPRSLLRIGNLGQVPSTNSPYRPVFLQRKAFWQSNLSERQRERSVRLMQELDKDINSFVSKVKESQRAVMGHQKEALKHILGAVHVIWPRARAKIFGSVAAGLSLPGSDFDIVLWLPPVRNGLKNILEVGILESGNAEKESFVQQLARQLARQSWVNQETLRVIDKTAIPLVSLEYNEIFPLSIDISFQSASHHGLLASAIVRELVSIFPTLAPMILVLKHFLQSQNLSKAYTGGLSSYCLTLILSSFLVHQPESTNESIARLLLDFLHFFGTSQGVQSLAFGLSGIDVVPEGASVFDPLWVSDPLQPGKNAAKNCFRILAIQKQMKIAYDKAEAMLMQGTGEEDRAGSGFLEKVFGCTGWGQ